MKKVFIKYNPYQIKTEFLVDGKHLKQYSEIRARIAEGSRLQEWVEDLPKLLFEEYFSSSYEIEFHGTLLDYEDLVATIGEANEKNKWSITSTHKPAKETSDKETLIDDIFADIQKGPFAALKTEKIINTFKNAKSGDFEVCVVAIMSAGKSTLINALLGTNLMPSKMEACTAVITRIKDTSFQDVPFAAKVFHANDDKKVVETYENLTYPIMERLNADENVATIEITGNIPFVSSGDISLVLVDTPGPTTARCPQHKKVFYTLMEKSTKPLILYIMTGEFATDDDNNLLQQVAASMKVGGKQSKDRFLFVINKLDDRKPEDGDIDLTLEKVRSYLKTEHEVTNPNIFPAAALPALSIRLMKNGVDIDDDIKGETNTKIKKLNRLKRKGPNGEDLKPLHFEKYASLPPSIAGKISAQVVATQKNWTGKEFENPDEALFHTGIPSIEAAIEQYVQKYAKTAKIKNIVDTFLGTLEAVDCFEKIKQEIMENQDKAKEIVAQIDALGKKIEDVKAAKEFKNIVKEAKEKANVESRIVIEDIIEKFQVRIQNKIETLCEEDIKIDEAEAEMAKLEQFAKKLEPDFEGDLDKHLRNSLIDTSNALLRLYKEKLTSLMDETNIGKMGAIAIDPVKLMSDSVVVVKDGFSLDDLVQKKREKDGTEWVAVPREPILGLGIRDWLFGVPQEERDKFKTVKYVKGLDLAHAYLRPSQEYLHANAIMAKKYAAEQAERIVECFNEEFGRLDNVLKAKLAELKSHALDKNSVDERIKESELNLKWLEAIKKRVESILEI